MKTIRFSVGIALLVSSLLTTTIALAQVTTPAMPATPATPETPKVIGAIRDTAVTPGVSAKIGRAHV